MSKGEGVEPVLDAYWPNTDGSYWHFDGAYREWIGEPEFTIYEKEDLVPPAPTPLEVKKRFFGRTSFDPDAGMVRLQFGLTFNGLITTDSGVTAQNLEESELGHGTKLSSRPVAESEDLALLASIYRARPDLRTKLAAAYPALARGGHLQYIPILLHGFAWEKTDEYIGGYGDLDQELAWRYLDGDLSLGATFDQQLVPSLVDDVWLHGAIGRKFEYTLPNGDRHPAIECDYVIDYGVMTYTDYNGNELGYGRVYDYGRVIYVADVGPVACYLRGVVDIGDPLGIGLTDHRFAMTAYSIAR